MVHSQGEGSTLIINRGGICVPHLWIHRYGWWKHFTDSIPSLKLTVSLPLKIGRLPPKGNEKVFQASISRCGLLYRQKGGYICCSFLKKKSVGRFPRWRHDHHCHQHCALGSCGWTVGSSGMNMDSLARIPYTILVLVCEWWWNFPPLLVSPKIFEIF